MRAISIEETGPPSVLRMREVDDPQPDVGQARVRVVAAGVNFADVVMRRGHIPSPLPMIPGVEGAGVVESIGEGVADVAVGDRVSWAPVMGAGAIVGSYAERECVAADALLPVPDAISLETAAAVTLQGLTAHYLVHDRKAVGPGSNVLVHAAAGGMGLLLCGWLKRLGARVIGTVSTREKASHARAAGADETILYSEEDFATRAMEITGGSGVDYVIDGVGKTTFRKNLDCMASQGHICLYGMASGPPDPISPLELLPKAVCISGGMMTNFLRSRDEILRKGAEVFAGVEAGWLKPPRVSVIPIEEAERAHALLEDRQSTGKLVLKVAEEG
ncbi:MAG: quinone oxidoreductase [Deltaproteobacteria bacterium]|jgi:NADPH2:quinone reductase|nr:quinone oxidoreductase [Deltaproteobacteria bacterium]MBW2500381.1 quinone oxidoreductase [Deltaproteobacteria bacterium]